MFFPPNDGTYIQYVSNKKYTGVVSVLEIKAGQPKPWIWLPWWILGCPVEKPTHLSALLKITSIFVFLVQYMLTLPLLSTAQNQRGLNWTGTLLLVYFWNFCINTITANHHAIWCEVQPRSLVLPCFLQFSFSFFFLVACIHLAQFSLLLRRRLYTSQKTPHLHSVKHNTCILFC